MPTKVRPKNIKKKLVPKAKSPEEVVEETEDAPIPAKKVSKPIEVEEEEVLPLVEKPEEVSPFGDVPAEDDDEDEAALDEEELNPFGDKWEV